MSIPSPKRLVASILVVSLTGFAVPAGAASPTATLTGTVLGADVRTPLAGVTVVVTDASGQSLASAPTGADGTFTVRDLGAGTTRLALSTADGSFSIATPVVLAPGQTRGVRVALKAKAESDEEKKKKKGGAVPPSDGGKGLGAMIAVLVGFVAAGAVAIGQSGDDGNNPAASPSNPD
ncbi:MAG TPA: carboxypeptidase-like regulatory domain-containing protein [Candidatus Polarisedimenticolaceae bacterium]|nr:carboxypeptidase-like regulatory domain-containing protein [Candidatus Polarisedimenticolaceae bacterium]